MYSTAMSNGGQRVFVVSVEVKPLRGSALWGKAGGFAYCYTVAVDASDAAARVSEALQEDHYALIAIEWTRPASEVEWEKDDEDQQRAYEAEARASREVVYSAFHVYDAR